MELVLGLRSQGRVRPFSLGLEEERERVGADVFCILNRILNSCDKTPIMSVPIMQMHTPDVEADIEVATN